MEIKEKDFEAIYKEYEERRAKAEAMGGAKGIESQHKEGKWTARERIQ